MGAGGRHSGSPSSASAPHDAAGCRPLPGGAQRRHDPFARALDLGLLRRPGLRRGDQRLRHLLEVAVGVEKALRQPLDQRRRRLVGDEMARELGRDVLRGRRMAREVGEHRAALLDAGVGDRSCRAPSAARARAARLLNTNSPP